MEPVRCGSSMIFVICCVVQWQHARGRPQYDQFSSSSYSDYSGGCEQSEFWSSQTSQCEECPLCPPGYESGCGYGEGEDASCDPCRPGYYNDGSDTVCSHCQHCKNRVTLQKCTNTTNTKCGECLAGCISFEGQCTRCPDIPVPRTPPRVVAEPTTPGYTSGVSTNNPGGQETSSTELNSLMTDVDRDQLDYIILIALFAVVILIVILLIGGSVIAKTCGAPDSLSNTKNGSSASYRYSNCSSTESETVQAISTPSGKRAMSNQPAASPEVLQVHQASSDVDDWSPLGSLTPKTERKEALQKYASVLTEISNKIEEEQLADVVNYVEHGVPNFHTRAAEKVTSFHHLAKTLGELEEYSITRPCVLVRGLHAAKRIDLSRKLYKVSQCEVHNQECFEDHRGPI